jgi:hypothetical protein
MSEQQAFELLPPGTALIDSIRAEKSPYYLWAGEVIDNGFDANGRTVRLTMNDRELSASDDGEGITKTREQAIVKIAQHGEMGETKLGRFGVGFKYKSIQHGRRCKVVSVSKDGKLTRVVDWEEMRRSGQWLYPAALWTAVPPNTPTGTTVTILDLITKPPAKKDFDRTIAEIQRRYYPAMSAGRTIILNGESITCLASPTLTDVVQANLIFGDERSAVVRGGLLVEPHSSALRQVDVCVAYRVIKGESAFGCNGYGGIRSMFARVDLIGPWKLTKFKDDLGEDPYLDELETEVENVLRPVLEKCNSASMSLRTKNLEQLLNEMLPSDMRMVRPEQKQQLNRKGEKRGDDREKEAEGTASRSGPTRKRKPPHGIKIEFAADLNGSAGYGRALFDSKSTRIQLAEDNPTISALMAQRDQRLAASSLYAIASLIYQGDLQTDKPQLFEDRIGLRSWRLAKDQMIAVDEAAA